MKRNRLAVLLAVLAFAFTAVGKINAQQHEQTVGDGGTSIKLINAGRIVLSGGTATVTGVPKLTANSNIMVFRTILGGATPGVTLHITTRTNGTGFVITSRLADGTTTASADASTVCWWLWE